MSSLLSPSKSVQNNQQPSITSQQIYQTLIRQTPNLYPLSKFKSNKATKQLFPDAAKYPDFFNYNLVSPGRVIKKLQGPESLIRGFYYQLMKLAFEIQVQDKDYIQVLKCVLFSPQFMLEQNNLSPSSGKNYSDLQYKKIVAQFMEVLIHQSIPNFQLTILSYPIVDEAMIKILENLLKFKSQVQLPHGNISSLQLLMQLSQLFEVTVMQYGSCFKFQESDIFLYEHSKTEFYIAFLNQMAQMSDMSNSSRKKDSSYEPNSSKKIININQCQDEYDLSGKRSHQTHEYINSQFQIETPSKQHQRNCSSNLTQSKRKSETKIQKNYRNTFGFNEVKVQNDNPSIVEYSSSMMVNSNDNPYYGSHEFEYQNVKNNHNRQSRQTIINELHHLVHPQTHNYELTKPSTRNDAADNFSIQIPNVQLANSISTPPTQLQISNGNVKKPENVIKSIQVAQNYQYQPKLYNKKVTFDQSSKFIAKSAQSDQVIGYTETSQHQNSPKLPEIESPKGKNDDLTNFTRFTQQIPLISTSSSKGFQGHNYLKSIQSPRNYGQSTSSSQFYIGQTSSKGIEEIKSVKPTPNPISPGGTQLNPLFKSSLYSNYLADPLPAKSIPDIPTTKVDNQYLLPKFQPEQGKSKEQQDLLYSPKPIISKPFKPEPMLKSNVRKDQTMGTLYRQFTETKLLDILPEPVQDNIRRMKRKFKGIHAKDFFGIETRFDRKY